MIQLNGVADGTNVEPVCVQMTMTLLDIEIS